MAKGIPDTAKLLRAAFTKPELEYLLSIEEFGKEFEKADMSFEDFERICGLGEELLLKREIGNSRRKGP